MRFQTQVLVLVWAGILGLGPGLGVGVGVVEALPGGLAEGRRAGLVVRQVSSVSASEHHPPHLSDSACWHASPITHRSAHLLHAAP